MGCFSFTRANLGGKRANFLAYKDVMKILIPNEFRKHYANKSFFKAKYEDYGNVHIDKYGECIAFDLYGFIAYLNRNMLIDKSNPLLQDIIKANPKGTTVGDYYHIVGEGGWEDTNIQENRVLGIALATGEPAHSKCKYKMKLCSASYKGNYEDCKYFSISDPSQGFYAIPWNYEIGNGFREDREPTELENYIVNYCFDTSLI